MYQRFYISNFLVIFLVLYFESFSVRRLAESSILSPLRNFVGGIVSRQSGNYNGNANIFPPETFLSTPEIIRLHGYPVEEHKVTTKDGSIISIFRIIHAEKGDVPKDQRKLEPVLIQHGLASSSDDFLQLNKKDILPYLLADSGHNVWLGNIRGNAYGKQHTDNISENDTKFYDFSQDELARDINEIIKYILKVENVPQLSYVCHSTGCTLISMAVSEEPGLNKVIKKGSFFAPGPYFSHTTSPAIRTVMLLPEFVLSTYSYFIAGGRMIPQYLNLVMKKYLPGICLRESTRFLCNSAIFSLADLNPEQITNDTVVKVFGHFPAETSMKLFIHCLQYVKSENFQKFDYGTEKNLELYGSTKPPLYNLSRVTFPVQGFYGVADILVPSQDVSRTFSELGNVVETIQVEDEKWTHMDFLFGKDARKQVYDKIVQFLSS